MVSRDIGGQCSKSGSKCRIVHQRRLGLTTGVCLHSRLCKIEEEMGSYKHFGAILTSFVCELFGVPPLEAGLPTGLILLP